MGAGKKYKIRLKSGKILRHLSESKIKLLLSKNELLGSEPTCLESGGEWAPFSSFLNLADLALNVLDQGTKTTEDVINQGEAQKTKSLVKDPLKQKPDQKPDQKRSTPKESIEKGKQEFIEKDIFKDVPTLVDIVRPSDPDLEVTKITTANASGTTADFLDSRTKIMTTNQNLPLYQSKGQRKPVAEAIGLTAKRMISKTTFLVLAVSLMIILLLDEGEEKTFLEELEPKIYSFKEIPINTLPKVKKINKAMSGNYLEKGIIHYDKETPRNYIKAAVLLSKAVNLNPKNIIARSLLARTYIQLLEILPRNEKLHTSLVNLLGMKRKTPLPRIPEYLAAKAEFLSILNRTDEAIEVIEPTVKRSPNPELLYVLAKLYKKKGEKNRAISLITRAIRLTPEGEKRASYGLLYAQLLSGKNRLQSAIRILKNNIKKNNEHGDSIYELAKTYYRIGKTSASLKALSFIIKNPQFVDELKLAKTFLLAATILRGEKKYKKSMQFALASKHLLPENQDAEDIIFDILARRSGSKKLYKYMKSAKEKEKAKEYQEALNLYTRAREMQSSNPTPLYYLTKMYEKTGRRSQAIEFYKKLIKLPKKKKEAFFDLAKLYINIFELNKAKSLMRAVRHIPRTEQRAAYTLGKIALRRKRIQKARSFFIRTLNLNSRIPELYVEMGNLELKKKSYGLAEFYYSIAVRYSSFHPEATLGLALSRFYLSSPTDAIQFLKNKLYTNPDSPEILTNLAIIYLKSGDKVSGKMFLHQAIKNSPSYGRAYRLMGDFVKEEGDESSNFDKKQKSYRFAMASYEAYVKLNPREPDGFMAIAELYFFIRDLGTAAKNYHKVLDIAPNYPNVRIQLAKIALNGGNTKKSLKFTKEEIKRNPNNWRAYLELGKIHIVKKEYHLALKKLTVALKIKPKEPEIIIYLGYINYLDNNFPIAIALFERARTIDPTRADIYWKLGLAYERNKNLTKARTAYKNYRGLASTEEDAQRAEAKLRRIGGN